MQDIKIKRDELHMMLGGGLPDGTLMIIEGDSGAGKSVLCQRLAFGLLENGRTVTIISTELTTKEFVNQMYSLDYPVATPLLRQKLQFVPVYPLLGRTKPRGDFLGRLLGSMGIFSKEVTIIDSLSALVRNSFPTEEYTFDMLAFFKRLTGMDKSIILTLEAGQLGDEIMAPLKAASHAMLDVQTKLMGGVLTRSIIVKRFSNVPNPVESVIGFRIEPKVGLIIEITSVG